MKTYWIIKVSSGKVVLTIDPNLYKSATGPFWTYQEAVKVLKQWINNK